MALALLDWIDAQRRIIRPQRGPLVRLVLRHSVAAAIGQGSDVESVDLAEGVATDQIARELEDAAQRDADGQTGVQLYYVHAFFASQLDRSQARYALRRTGADAEDDANGPSEPATARGLVAQAQRQQEIAFRLTVGTASATIDQLRRALRERDDQIERLQGKHLDLLRLVEDLSSLRAERDAVAETHALKRRVVRDAFERAMSVLPFLVNRLAGERILEANHPAELALRTFVGSLKREQVDRILGQLEPHQQLQIVEMLERYATVKDDAPQLPAPGDGARGSGDRAAPTG